MSDSTRTRRRRGSFLVEAVVACVLLGAGLVALAKLTSTSAKVERALDLAVSLKLTAENFVQRTRHMDASAYTKQAIDIASGLSADSGHQVDVRIQPFKSESGEGVHAIITASAKPDLSVTLHDWRLADEGRLEEGPQE